VDVDLKLVPLAVQVCLEVKPRLMPGSPTIALRECRVPSPPLDLAGFTITAFR